jgi:hypothetical protein
MASHHQPSQSAPTQGRIIKSWQKRVLQVQMLPYESELVVAVVELQTWITTISGGYQHVTSSKLLGLHFQGISQGGNPFWAPGVAPEALFDPAIIGQPPCRTQNTAQTQKRHSDALKI